jgi:hypothetical protein
MTRLAHAAGNARYLRITVRRNVPPDVRASSLAHELQHAIEIALADVSTHVEMEQLYERIGHRRHGTRFYETRAAEEAGARAWAELHGSVAVAAQ